MGIERDRLLFSEAQNMKMDKSKITGSKSRPEALLNQIIRKDIPSPKEKKEIRYSPSKEQNDNEKSFDDKDKSNLESDKASRNIDPEASVALNNGYLKHKYVIIQKQIFDSINNNCVFHFSITKNKEIVKIFLL